MKLLIYSHAFWPSIGGAETYARALAEQISRDSGFEVTVATETPVNGRELDCAFKIIRHPSILELWTSVRTADLVFSAGPALLPMILARIIRKPLVIEQHGYQAICPNGLLLNKVEGGVCSGSFLRKKYGNCVRCVALDRGTLRGIAQVILTKIRRWLCTGADANVAVSGHVRSRLKLPSTTVIYHGLPDPQVEPALSSNSLVHFAYIGRFVGEKGVPLLVKASALLQAQGIRHRLTLIGDGPLMSDLKAQVNEHGTAETVRFTGYLEGPALKDVVSDVDVVVMPSVCEETAGLSAMEQMLRGRVVLASDIGGLGEIVGDGGMKFRPFDIEDLVRKMRELSDPELRRSLGTVARDRAMRLFRLERMVDDHKRLFRAALDA